MVHRLGHRQQASLCMADVEALEIKSEDKTLSSLDLSTRDPRGHGGRQTGSYLDMQFQWYRAHIRVEGEGGSGTTAQPVSHILGIGQ